MKARRPIEGTTLSVVTREEEEPRRDVLEVQPHRELNHARRPRRCCNADRGAEVRVHLLSRGVELRVAIDVIELRVVQDVVHLGPELERLGAAEPQVLEQRDVPVVDARTLDDIARGVADSRRGPTGR